MTKTDWRTKDEVIAEYAYRIYEDRMRTGTPGDADSDWYAAVAEYDEACDQGWRKLIEYWEEELLTDINRWTLSAYDQVQLGRIQQF